MIICIQIKLVAKEYVGNSDWLCKCDCGEYSKVHLSDLLKGRTSSCGCNNVAINGSKQELEIKDFIKELLPNVEIVKSRILEGKEIDIFLPELEIGIEYNGSPFHASDNSICRNKPMLYHQGKFLLAKSKGIHLITIFDKDWEENKEEIKNIIKKYSFT